MSLAVPLSAPARVISDDGHAAWHGHSVETDHCSLVVHGRGYAFDGDTLLRDASLVGHVAAVCAAAADPEIAFRELITRLNGAWALVLRIDGEAILGAVDRSRAVPLLYRGGAEDVVFSATLPPLLELPGPRPRIDDSAAAELLLSGYVSGHRTIYRDIYSVEAGQVVRFDLADLSQGPRRDFYFVYYPAETTDQPAAELVDELEAIVRSMFRRHARAFANRPAVLPLSGGFDSRLIGYMLRQEGVTDIDCYTYGVRSNPQVELARRVAEALGFKWTFQEYNRNVWADAVGSTDFPEYLHYAFRGNGSPHLQDFAALRAFTSGRTMADRPYFLPGHVGDAWANEFAVRDMREKGSHPPSEYHSPFVSLLDNDAVSTIVYRHLNLWPLTERQRGADTFSSVFGRIADNLSAYPSTRSGDMWKMIEWVLRSRTAHWINNSCRAFEFFGGDSFLCLGDYEMMDFFRKLPKEHILDRNLYHRTMRERILPASNPVLGGIPVMSGGTRNSRKKRKVVDVLNALHLFKPLERLRRPLRGVRNLSAETWFCRGTSPERVTIGEALAPYGVKEHLPSELWEVIRPYRNKPVYSIQCNGLLAAVLLAGQYERQSS